MRGFNKYSIAKFTMESHRKRHCLNDQELKIRENINPRIENEFFKAEQSTSANDRLNYAAFEASKSQTIF